MLGEKGCIRERFNRREVTVPQLAMHVGEPQMTVVKKRDNDSQILKKKVITGKYPHERLNERPIHWAKAVPCQRGPE